MLRILAEFPYNPLPSQFIFTTHVAPQPSCMAGFAYSERYKGLWGSYLLSNGIVLSGQQDRPSAHPRCGNIRLRPGQGRHNTAGPHKAMLAVSPAKGRYEGFAPLPVMAIHPANR